jgi:hypothetical protein
MEQSEQKEQSEQPKQKSELGMENVIIVGECTGVYAIYSLY